MYTAGRQTFVSPILYKEWSERKRCFIATVLQLHLRLCHRNVQANQEEFKLNVTHQLLLYADHDVSLLGESIQTAKKNTELLLDDSKQIGLEANAESTNISSYFTNRM
jgi:hypothetical protein